MTGSPDLALLGGLLLLAVALATGGTALLRGRRGHLDRQLRHLRRQYRAVPVAEAEIGDDGDGNSPLGWLIALLQAISKAMGSRFVNGKQQGQLQLLLWQAGIRRRDGVRLLMALKVLSAAVGAAVLVPLALSTGRLPGGTIFIAGIAIAGALVGGMLPESLLKRRAKARQVRITERLPDALDLLIIFANAGYGMDLAIQRLAAELGRSSPDLSDELTVTSDELRLLSEPRQALENLMERTGQAPVRNLVGTMLQAQKYGTPLSQALRALAGEMRNARIIAMEERAARVPVLITMPLIMLILPAIMLIVGTPAILQAGRLWPK